MNKLSDLLEMLASTLQSANCCALPLHVPWLGEARHSLVNGTECAEARRTDTE